MNRILILSLLLMSHAWGDTPALISSDYQKQEALALAALNQTLEKAATPLIAGLIADGNTASAEELTTQLKAKQAGEPVPTPHSSAALLFAQYDQARFKALEPVQKSAITRIEAMLKRRDNLKLETVTELGKLRAQIEPASTAPETPATPTPATTAPAGTAPASSRPATPSAIADLVQKLGGTITQSSEGNSVSFVRAAVPASDLLIIGTDKRLKSFNWNSGSGLTDEGMAAFEGMKNLDNLFLWGVGSISDAGLAHLDDCVKIEVLNIGGNGDKITGSGLEHLARCKSLRRLTLNYLSNFEGQNLRHLTGHKALKLLYLSNCKKIADADMEWVSKMTQLVELNLGNTAVTDAGVAKLKSLTHLVELIVSEPLVTKAGVEVLTKARPGLKVTFTK